MQPCDTMPQVHVPGTSTRAYLGEKSGKHAYAFNSFGYRCDEYDPSAALHIGVIGASNTMGIGLGYEDTFAFRFKQFMAELHGLAPAQVCLTNLSVSGVSNDYCVRTLYRQVPDYRPDLFIYDLVGIPRMEHLEDRLGRPLHIYGKDEKSLAFLDLYDKPLGIANLLKNMLLATALFEKYKIPYIVINGLVDFPSLKGISTCGGFYKEVDFSRVVNHDYYRLMFDRSDEKNHIGPVSHKAIALALLEFYGKALEGSDGPLAARAAEIAARYKVSDSDWSRIDSDAKMANVDPTRLAKPGSLAGFVLDRLPEPMLRLLARWCEGAGSSICKRLYRL